MPSYKPPTRASRRSKPSRRELSPRTKKILVITVACVVVLVGGIWAFDALTIPDPPDLKTAPADQVAEFFGSRGYSHLSIPEREEFLVNVARIYNQTPEKTEALQRAFDRLSFSEQQRCLDNTVDVVKDKFMKAADEYHRTPQAARQQFVLRAMRNLDAMRQQLSGRGTSGKNTWAGAFKNHIPQRSDAWTKAIVDRTTPSERANAKPLIDDLAKQYDLKRQRERSRRTG